MLIDVGSRLILACAAGLSAIAEDDAPIFSGPQVGESVVGFDVRLFLSADKGVIPEEAEPVDLIKASDGKPMLVMFVHKLTRPSVGLVRATMAYAADRRKDGLQSAVVFLGDDAVGLRKRLVRAKHALPPKTDVGISVEGHEGPGAYGLNRNVTLTVVLAHKGKVTANFAIVQPSLPNDAPRIAKAVTDVVGGKAPTLGQLQALAGMRNARRGDVTGLLRGLIQKDLEPEMVDRRAERIVKFIANRPAARKQLGQIASRVAGGPKFESYGTPRARHYLAKWAKEFGPKKDDRPKQKESADE